MGYDYILYACKSTFYLTSVRYGSYKIEAINLYSIIMIPLNMDIIGQISIIVSLFSISLCKLSYFYH